MSVDTPLVIQCRACRAIAGDSFSWFGAEKELHVLMLSKASIKLSEDRQFSLEGRTSGACYQLFHCQQCAAQLGRLYTSTPVEVDVLRNQFCFDLDHITCYQLGTGENPPRISENVDPIFSIPTAYQLMEELSKVQQLLLLMNERVERLEAIVEKQP